MFKKTI